MIKKTKWHCYLAVPYQYNPMVNKVKGFLRSKKNIEDSSLSTRHVSAH